MMPASDKQPSPLLHISFALLSTVIVNVSALQKGSTFYY